MVNRGVVLAAAIILISLVSICQAAPTTLAATNVGNNNFTFNGNGAATTNTWFQWGMADGQTWAHTPNVSSSSGVFNYTLIGSPVFGSTEYFYVACDETGCGNQVSLTTLPVTPLPAFTYGVYAQNMTEQRFDPGNVFWNSMRPYTNLTGETIFYGLVFAMVFVGIWLRTRQTGLATIFGMICMGLFASTATGLQLGLPPEFLAVGQALMYISLASAVVAFTFR